MATYNDGNLPYGFGGLATDETTGVDYVIEDFSIDLASTVIERRDGQGVMTGRVVIDDQPEGSPNGGPRGFTATLTLQRATVTTPIPGVGNQINLAAVPGIVDLVSESGGDLFCIVTGSTGSQSQTTAHTFSLRVAGEIPN